MQPQVVDYDNYAQHRKVSGEIHAVVFSENRFGELQRQQPRNKRGEKARQQLSYGHGRSFAADYFHQRGA